MYILFNLHFACYQIRPFNFKDPQFRGHMEKALLSPNLGTIRL